MRQMDRERLKDVQTSDLKDDRLNEDFVLWLKTKGPSWLLVFLVAIVAYLFIVNWQQQEARHHANVSTQVAAFAKQTVLSPRARELTERVVSHALLGVLEVEALVGRRG